MCCADVAARKRAARAAVRSRRHALIMPDGTDEARRTERLLALPELGSLTARSTVACYVARGHEPQTALLLSRLHDRGVRVLLPVVLADLDLDWALDEGEHDAGLGPGVPEPTGPRLGVEAIGEADVVVTPALAVDRQGRRLGQGGGSYDRALARRAPGALVVAVVGDDELVPGPLPGEEHDVRVDAVVTPGRGMVRLPAAVAGPT